MMNTFQITQRIEDIYPDIEQELCSKHTILLNHIHKCFNKQYPALDPQYYVIANQTKTLVKGVHNTVDMAMEQGVIIMLAPGAEDDFVNISSNCFPQVLMEKTGKIMNIEQEPQFSGLAKKAIELAIDDLSLNKMKGGFMFIHIHEGQTISSLAKEVILALFTAMLLLNDVLQEYTLQELSLKLKSLSQFKDNTIAENYFMSHSNRSLLISCPHSSCEVTLDPKFKLLFVNLQFLGKPKEEWKVEAKQEKQELDTLIDRLGSGQVDLNQFFSHVSELQLKSINNEDIVKFVKDIVQKFKFKSSMFVDRYCVFLVQSYRYAEVIGKLSKIIHEILASFSPEEELELYNKGKSSCKIRSLLFTSVPSSGLSVLNPTTSVWF